MLDFAREGVSKTRIMYKAYLSYTQLVEYLKYLQKNDLLTYDADTQLYRSTEKGLKFLTLSNDLSEMVS
jgi:predicted transcriptional regulator